MGFKYAFNTWVYGSFPAWLPCHPIEEVIKRLASFGYDGIEIGCAAPHAFPAHLTSARRKSLRALMKDQGIACVSLLPAPGGGMGNNPASFEPEERKMAIAHYKEVVDLANDLGAGRVLYVCGWRGFGVAQALAWEWTRNALADIAAHAADKGIEVCLEPTPADSNLVDTVGDAMRLKAEVGAANIGLMFDTFHTHHRAESAQDSIVQLGDQMTHIHISDTDRMPPGAGKLDWSGIMTALKAAKFEGHLTMEIGFPYRNIDPDWVAKTAIGHLKAIEKSLD
jgi:protein FrlC